MAVGIPVVASNAGALPEVLGDAAILVEPNSVTQLAEALYKAITDEALRAKLIEKGKARARSFSWVETARRVARVYEHVLKECA
jgi:glycosyltransferase involved in cell wall biosynthesis